jgi:hypothetical protein
MSGGVEKVQAVGVQVRRSVSALGLAALITFTAGCGNGNGSVSGEYVGQPGSWVDKLVFGPGNEVRSFDGGDAAAGVFKVEGKEILLTIGTDQNKVTIADNGCLDAGRLGMYCKR